MDSHPLPLSSTHTPVAPVFTGMELDHMPDLLVASYRLRYQVYCHERHFLPADYYPDGIETDVFDQYAVHLGVVNAHGDLIATARLVRRTAEGLPMFGRCSLVVPDPALTDPLAPLVEVSRLAVSKQYNRRKGDDHYALSGAVASHGGDQRRGGAEIVMTLYCALYQASKRHGFTHWLIASERSLLRLVTRFRFPFTQVGPESEYYGLVAPYLMDLARFDREIVSGQVPALQAFLVGLEPHLQPQQPTEAYAT